MLTYCVAATIWFGFDLSVGAVYVIRHFTELCIYQHRGAGHRNTGCDSLYSLMWGCTLVVLDKANISFTCNFCCCRWRSTGIQIYHTCKYDNFQFETSHDICTNFLVFCGYQHIAASLYNIICLSLVHEHVKLRKNSFTRVTLTPRSCFPVLHSLCWIM